MIVIYIFNFLQEMDLTQYELENVSPEDLYKSKFKCTQETAICICNVNFYNSFNITGLNLLGGKCSDVKRKQRIFDAILCCD